MTLEEAILHSRIDEATTNAPGGYVYAKTDSNGDIWVEYHPHMVRPPVGGAYRLIGLTPELQFIYQSFHWQPVDPCSPLELLAKAGEENIYGSES